MPLAGHLLGAFLLGTEADESWMLLFGLVFVVLILTLLLLERRRHPAVCALAPLWPAWLFTRTHLYWKMGAVSPGGAAQAVMRRLGWAQPGAPEAVVVSLGLVSVLVVLLYKADKEWRRGRLRNLWVKAQNAKRGRLP